MGIVISLVLIGVLLLLAEILIIPGVGVTGILGLVSLGGSCFYAYHEMGGTAGTVVTTVVCLLVVLMLVFVLRGKTWTKLALKTSIESKATPGTIKEIDLGQKGEAVTRLSPMGSVRFDDEVVEVKSLDGMLERGTQVTVVLIEDNKIYVKQINEY